MSALLSLSLSMIVALQANLQAIQESKATQEDYVKVEIRGWLKVHSYPRAKGRQAGKEAVQQVVRILSEPKEDPDPKAKGLFRYGHKGGLIEWKLSMPGRQDLEDEANRLKNRTVIVTGKLFVFRNIVRTNFSSDHEYVVLVSALRAAEQPERKADGENKK